MSADVHALALELIERHGLRSLGPGCEVVLSDFANQGELDAFYGAGTRSIEEHRAVNAVIQREIQSAPVRVEPLTMVDCVEFLNAPSSEALDREQTSGFAEWRRCWVNSNGESEKVV